MRIIVFTAFLISLFNLGVDNPAFSQISPGELYKGHSNLEGMSNCTKCHNIGAKISNDKCLACHTEIKEKINLKKGYHVSVEVKGKECASCHNDHHGKNFQIIRFTVTNFQHNITGYKLEGAHTKKQCTDCHNSKYITNTKLKTKPHTYLGLNTKCVSCHTDYHQNTLTGSCSKCHGQETFKPAVNFNHTNSKFPLIGQHLTVDCSKCHAKEIREGKPFQQFTGLQFGNCTSCHKDPHQNSFGQNCKQCHTETSFHNIKGNSNFDHSKTGFALEGRHRSISCTLCHKNKITDPIKHDNCTDCHKDYHKGQFAKSGLSPDCSKCHTVKGFSPSNFTVENHNQTEYKLQGLHTTVDCFKCHKKQDTWSFRNLGKNCMDCHTDYHKGQFSKSGLSTDCSKCHTSNGFSPSNFTLEKHNQSQFKLIGAHTAVACIDCHKKQDTWSFRNIGNICVDCHKNIHKLTIPQKYYPNENCKICHIENSWNQLNFDHSKTNFRLNGAHLKTNCRSCHFIADKTGKGIQKFEGLPKNCNNCHTDNHNKQFDKNGITDCEKCHATDNWKASKFEHNKTAFPLDGKHENVDCAKCHKKEKDQKFIIYKIKDFRCEACHK
jgi:hypothetical protein